MNSIVDMMPDIGQRFKEALEQTKKCPYNVIAFVSRSSANSTPIEADRIRYRVLRLQVDLLKAWIKCEQWTSWKDGKERKASILGILSWRVCAATQPLAIRPTQVKRCRVYEPKGKRNTYYSLQGNDKKKRKMYLLRLGKTFASNNMWVQARADEMVLLLQGATALTVDVSSWVKLSEHLAKNGSSTQVVIFEPEQSPLGSSAEFQSIGGGYRYNTYDLTKIGEYLQALKKGKEISIPPAYSSLFDVWEGARESRAENRRSTSSMRAAEGKGRTFQQHNRRRPRGYRAAEKEEAVVGSSGGMGDVVCSESI